MEWLDSELIRSIAGDKFAQQFFMWTTSLGLASYIHSGRVKKSIDNLATALMTQLDSHGKKIELVETKVNDLGGRLSKLEIIKGEK